MRKTLLRTLFATIMLVFSSAAIAQTEKFSRVKIYTNAAGLNQLAELGVCVDHGENKPGYWYCSDFSESEIEIIRTHGFSYEIIIPDVSDFYVQQNN